MSDESNINFSVAEKYSYVYADEKFSKLAVTATGNAKLVDPLAWSYAETHSYVKVDPSSVGVSVPSGVDELYAKVIYIPGGSGGGSSGSGVPGYHTHSINDIINLSISLNALSSAISTHTHQLSAINGLSDKINKLNSNDSALSTAIGSLQNKTYSVNDISGLTEYVSETTLSVVADSISGFATKEFVLENIPSAVSQFINDSEYVTSGYVNEILETIEVPTKTSELENDSKFVTINDVDSLIFDLEETLERDIKTYVDDSLPTNVSELENDANYVPLSTVQEMMDTMALNFNHRLVIMELRLNENAIIDMGEHGNDPSNSIIGGDREDESMIFDFGERTPDDSSDLPQDYSFEEMQQLAASNSIVQMNSRLNENGSFVAGDRLVTDTENETINFNYRQ